ncbi:type I restriction enzyme EcoKI subunit R [Gimesia panareensis]|uniref:Type I restriction enzyme EcoKI subunit R n=1 Tax=Gimesia panareensis TaxID=2527978 RepID=A0A518FY37_9PLAN|nr:type I restriction endonuclease subunit R [Gimesia panareensis]QDV21272.1 type I restriction enzyme EcoKI subunit R [Gimesia panareensis]
MNNEALTRSRQVDVQLRTAGWMAENRRVIEEYVITSSKLEDSNEFADYVLIDNRKEPLAIVEAKRSSRSALEGERQAADYADRILQQRGVDPFIFLANGNEIWFHDRSLYPVRKVSGFFAQDDLERLRFLRQYRQLTADSGIDKKIAGRGYQIEAIRTVCERIEASKRQFLLVMATGTGKTRTVIGLVDLLIRCQWVQRVLFLADRRELVKQALDAFKEHMPSVPRDWIESGKIDTAAQVLAATYPGMMSVYQKLSPGFFDLIIFDESHRSIYNRYKAIPDHFDAIHVGLTATPTDFIDHNTFELFDCEDGLPTFHYGLEEAIRDNHLVPYRPVHVAKTQFQVEGLKPGSLPPEVQAQLREQGIDPSEVDFEGTDLERKVSNTGTNDAIVREFMDVSIKDASGTLPAKTIIFAISHKHALEIYQSFNRLYPDLQRRSLAKVIDSHMERADKTLDDFKNRDFPRVAISVDMLDTGIDIPAIRNLVFAKPVFSQVKFWQMIGRGTRTWTDPVSGEEKKDFLIIDHWDNFAYWNVNSGEDDGPVATEPLPTRIFRQRLESLEILSGRNQKEDAAQELSSLQQMLGSLPLDNINISPHTDEIKQLISNSNEWLPMTEDKHKHLVLTIAPLLRFSTASGYVTLQFENLTQQLIVAHLKSDADEVERLRGRICENLSLLPRDIPEVRGILETLDEVQSGGYWEQLTWSKIRQIQDVFTPLMRFRSKRYGGQMIKLSIRDEIRDRHWIVFGPSGEGAFVDTYRQQVEAYIRDLSEQSPALQKMREGEELTEEELESISSLLERPDLFITEDKLREVYSLPDVDLKGFLAHILKVSEFPSRDKQISQAFDEWIAANQRLNATQLMFIRTLRQFVLSRTKITSVDDFKQPPFNRIGDPQKLFTPQQLNELLAMVADLAA